MIKHSPKNHCKSTFLAAGVYLAAAGPLAATPLLATDAAPQAASGGSQQATQAAPQALSARSERSSWLASSGVARPAPPKRFKPLHPSEIASSRAASPKSGRKMTEEARMMHLLNRMAFGAAREDLEAIRERGIESYIKEQLKPEAIPLTAHVEQVAQIDALRQTPAELFLNFGRPALKALAQNGSASETDKKELAKILRETYQKMYEDAALARLTRAVESPRQLQEVMVDFWFNHFNVSIDKGLDHVWVGSYEETAIRPHALGRFRDLLGATARHAAMLFYLDNWQNTAAGATGVGGRFKGINENYARELMELHTLGVDGGYTQKDVQELARVLTGLGLPPKAGGGFGLRNPAERRAMLRQKGQPGAIGQFAPFGEFGNRPRNPFAAASANGLQDVGAAPAFPGNAAGPVFAGNGIRNYGMVVDLASIPGDPKFGSYFDQRRHDFGDKILLGHRIQGRGEAEIDEVLDLLARHPSTAHHISYKLAQYFVADEPPESLVSKLAKKFTASDGQMSEVLDTLFHSDEFWDARYKGAKFKSPYRYLVSSIRATDAKIDKVGPLLAFLKQTGMPLYKCLTPDGYKNTQEAWLNPDNLLTRLNFATAFGAGRYPGVRLTEDSSDLAVDMIGDVSDTTLQAIESAPPQLRLSLLLGSPEFMKY